MPEGDRNAAEAEETELRPEPEMKFGDDEGEASAAWEQLPPEREFFATPYDPPIKALVQEIKDRELEVRPSFQRYAIWDEVRKSKLIESVLLNIPIPTLFFAEDDDKTRVVVDGQQRLLAVKEFLENRYALSGLEVLRALVGKRFDDLTPRQQKIIRNRSPWNIGAPGGIRTPDPRLRRPMLYPTELQARAGILRG